VKTQCGSRLRRRVSLLMAAAMTAATTAASADSSAPVATTGDNQGLAQAQIWFERAIRLDTGVDGARDAVAAYAEMRRAAEAGHPDAAFNVAVMLDSGRGAPRNASAAAVWYARAAARGIRRAAFNLGQLYERGEGVPANGDLARAWYVAADLPAARERLGEVKEPLHRPNRLVAPQLLFPPSGSAIKADLKTVDLVWTAPVEPEAVRYFVELRGFDPGGSHEQWSGYVDVSSVQLPLPPNAENFAWRVSAVARGGGDYVISVWSIICQSTSTVGLGTACKTVSVSQENDP
jgi:hypothetical protein